MNRSRCSWLNQSSDDSRQLLPVTSDLVEGLYGYIDTQGKRVIEPRFTLARLFAEGLAAVCYRDQDRETSHWGFIDMEGNWVIPPRFKWASSFVSGQAWAGLDNGSVLLDRQGQVIKSLPVKVQIEPESDNTGPLIYSRIVAWVRCPDSSMEGWFWRPAKKYGLLSQSGDVITDPCFGWAGDASQGLVLVRHRSRMDYVDSRGRVVKGRSRILGGYAFSEGLAAVQALDRRWGYIDLTGKMIIPPRFEEANPFNEGLAPVKPVDKGGWEIIDNTGRIVERLNQEIQLVDSFSGGLALVMIGDRYGYIDRQGNLAFPLQDFESSGFRQGYAEAFVGLIKTYIDREGRIIWLPKGC